MRGRIFKRKLQGLMLGWVWTQSRMRVTRFREIWAWICRDSISVKIWDREIERYVNDDTNYAYIIISSSVPLCGIHTCSISDHPIPSLPGIQSSRRRSVCVSLPQKSYYQSLGQSTSEDPSLTPQHIRFRNAPNPRGLIRAHCYVKLCSSFPTFQHVPGNTVRNLSLIFEGKVKRDLSAGGVTTWSGMLDTHGWRKCWTIYAYYDLWWLIPRKESIVWWKDAGSVLLSDIGFFSIWSDSHNVSIEHRRNVR